MSRFKDHPQIYDQPICLSKEQISDPTLTIKDFFASYRLSEIRKIQDDIQKVCLTTEDAAFGNSKGRSNLLRYNDKLICLLEAASQLQEKFNSSDKVPKPERATTISTPVRSNYKQVSEVVRAINDVAVDVAKLCVIVMNAWHSQVLAEMKMTPKSKKGFPPTSAPPMDLDKLHFMALTIQNKLATLANIAIDILMKEMNIYLTIPNDTSPMKSDLA
jgi:hypothetical protein